MEFRELNLLLTIAALYTHVATPPKLLGIKQAFKLKTQSTKVDELWDEPGNEIVPPILDAGVVVICAAPGCKLVRS